MREGWTQKLLGDVCRFQAGNAFGREGQGRSSGDHPFIKVSDMNLAGNELYIVRANNWISDDEAQRDYRLHPKGAVIFAKIGIALTYNRRRRLTRPTALDNNMMAAVCVPKINPTWFYYLLTTLDFNTISAGSALPYLTVKDLSQIPIEVPTSRDQDGIAEVLGSLDEKIVLNRRMNETLEATAQAIFKDWFIDFGPIRAKIQRSSAYLPDDIWALFPNRLDSDGKPSGWISARLGELVDQRNERTIPSPETAARPYVPIDCISPKSLSLSESKPGVEAQSSLIKFYRHDFLFGAMRPYFHKVCSAPFDGTTRTTNFVLRPHKDQDFSFCCLLLHSSSTIEYATNHSTGTTIPYAAWKNSLENMPIEVPPLEIRKSFDELTRPILTRLPETYFENNALAAIREFLLPRLISGEVRVRDAERLVGEIT